MTEPRDAAESSDPMLANDPIENADSAEPTHPIESTEPTEPIESTEPLLPMLSNEFSDRMDHLDDDMRPSSLTSRACAHDSRHSLVCTGSSQRRGSTHRRRRAAGRPAAATR
jgi:hypothetical protein